MKNYLKEKTDKNGRIKLNELNFSFDSEEILDDSFFAKNWIKFFNGDKYLLKTVLFPSELFIHENSTTPIQNFEYNSLLVHEILNMLGIESASYYLAKYNEEGIVLTPSFLKENEEFYDKHIYSQNIEEIIKELRELKFSEELINDFIIQSLVSRFVGQTDEKDSNWGIIHNKETNEYKIAPMYDFEYTCFATNQNRCRYVIDENGYMNSNLFALFMHFKDNLKVQKLLLNIILNFDLEEAFNRVKENTEVKIDEQNKIKYVNFFKKQMFVIDKLLHQFAISSIEPSYERNI